MRWRHPDLYFFLCLLAGLAAQQKLAEAATDQLIAHAAMEPMNCTVHLRKDGCDIWVGTQAPTLTQAVVAQRLALPPRLSPRSICELTIGRQETGTNGTACDDRRTGNCPCGR